MRLSGMATLQMCRVQERQPEIRITTRVSPLVMSCRVYRAACHPWVNIKTPSSTETKDKEFLMTQSIINSQELGGTQLRCRSPKVGRRAFPGTSAG